MDILFYYTGKIIWYIIFFLVAIALFNRLPIYVRRIIPNLYFLCQLPFKNVDKVYAHKKAIESFKVIKNQPFYNSVMRVINYRLRNYVEPDK